MSLTVAGHRDPAEQRNTMTEQMPTPLAGTDRVKRGLAEQLKGGVIMDVVTPD